MVDQSGRTTSRKTKRVLHVRVGDLGMRPMEGDEIARKYQERWYATACGVEASSMNATSKPQDGPLHTICPDCLVTDPARSTS